MKGARAGQIVIALALVVLATSCITGRKHRAEYVPGIWPTEGKAYPITSPFGYRKDPINGKKRLHKGVDIDAPPGSRVVATARGKVTTAGFENNGYGNVVMINHGNGYETLYAHMDHVKTREGKKVKRGAVIGTVGQTGRATGPHLQYEVHANGEPVDPMRFLPRATQAKR